eukprot:7848883-Lingulodinium_polyedra.AAC.1
MGGRAGSMLAVFPRNDRPPQNIAMRRARWANPEVVIEYSVSAMRKEAARCGGTIIFSPSGSAPCDFIVPTICARR